MLLPDVWVPLIAAFIPLLTAAAARSEADNNVRALVAIGAAGLLAVAERLVDGSGGSLEELLVAFGVAFVAQLTAYVGVWKLFAVNDRILPDGGVFG